MKKVTGIILAVLLLTVCAFAFAEETAEPAQAPELFDLWDYGAFRSGIGCRTPVRRIFRILP